MNEELISGAIAELEPYLPPAKLPWYAVNETDPNDQVFTKKEIAIYCWKVFKNVAKRHNFNMCKRTFIEPSAGEGCFMNLFPSNKLAFDIDPHRNDVIKQDFLSWNPKGLKRIAVIGNPPFGVRGAIALAFLNRAAYFSDLVAFILPMTFASDGKGGAMGRVKGLTLLHSEELAKNSFYTPDGRDKNINTIWQVWGKGVKIRKPTIKTCNDYIDIFTACSNPNRRCGMRRLNEAAYFIQSTFYKPPKVVKRFEAMKYGAGYGIVIKKNKREIKKVFRNVDWTKYSSRATNHCHHIRMRHIRDAIMDKGFCDK